MELPRNKMIPDTIPEMIPERSSGKFPQKKKQAMMSFKHVSAFMHVVFPLQSLNP